jgi:hypothetical protein
VVGDLGYIHQDTKRKIRERWAVGVVTKLRSDMNLVRPFVDPHHAQCPQGEPLEWLGYEALDALHWFGVRKTPACLCNQCWQAADCSRQFSFPASHHETLLGLLPLNTQVAQRLLSQVRSWIEPTQSYEKNQLGLGAMFLNSLKLTWTVSLLADSVALLRTMALLKAQSSADDLLSQLRPQQLSLGLPLL